LIIYFVGKWLRFWVCCFGWARECIPQGLKPFFVWGGWRAKAEALAYLEATATAKAKAKAKAKTKERAKAGSSLRSE
jgi:hypothetical protein